VKIVGKTRYLKNLKEEIKTKKEIAQIYLVVYGFLLPHILTIVSQSSNNRANTCIIFYLFIFVFSILIYYLDITKADDLAILKTTNINNTVIFVAFSFSFTVAVYLVLYKGLIPTDVAKSNNDFLIF